jgi:signal peptidase I
VSTHEPSGAEEQVATQPPVPDADVDPMQAAPPTRHRKDDSDGSSFWKELPFLVLIALVLALLIKTFLVQAFYIPSASMENTLQGGGGFAGAATTGSHPYDRVLVNKLVYDFRDPHRGEIVVFKKPPGWPNESDFTTPSNPVARFFHDVGSAVGIAPSGGSDFIKRVIGVGGDTVACNNDVLSVNGHVLNETYLYPGSHPCSSDSFDNVTKVVPKGDLFVMGDHRDDSDDSRSNGFVPVKDVIGRAFVVIWPIKDWKTLPIPSTLKQVGLAAAGSPATPFLAAAAIVTPIGLLRRRSRRKRARRAAFDAASYAAGNG